MTSARSIDALGGRRFVLRGAFLLIIGGFALTNVASLLEMQSGHAKNDLVVDNMLTSIELVSRIARDIDQKRLLLDAHILESGTPSMQAVEARLAKLDGDYSAAAAAYEPLATLTGEAAVWQRLQDNVAAIAQPVNTVLGLSRQNHDGEARAQLALVEGRFDAISRTADALIKINHDGAEQAVAQILAQQREVTLFLGAVTIGGTALALLVAGWVSRTLAQRDREIRRATSQLEERNRELDAFAGRVAHDLRGPLTTVSLSASRLSEHLPKEEGALSVLRRGVGRMESLIQDLLALSRIDVQLPGSLSAIATVVAGVETDLRPKVEGAGGLLRVDVAAATVCGKDGLLHQVLWNLGENAVKYRRLDVPVEVTLQGRPKGQGYELRVSDNGAGMPPDEARRAFEPFFRGEEARLATPGTGLGLAIVKRIVEASGGTVSVESQVGRGTTFLVRLQLAEREQQPPAAGRD